MFRTVLAVAATAVVVGCASNEPAMTHDTAMGKVLADSKGMTLYTFDKDVAGKSNCNGQCAVNWPPLKASADDKAMGEWSVVTRDDGAKQWAYKGMPVYGWIKDNKPGDTTGEGVNGVWRVAKP
jgi:predicted lipoprotein with Yx(FWY)xxD motif